MLYCFQEDDDMKEEKTTKESKQVNFRIDPDSPVLHLSWNEPGAGL